MARGHRIGWLVGALLVCGLAAGGVALAPVVAGDGAQSVGPPGTATVATPGSDAHKLDREAGLGPQSTSAIELNQTLRRTPDRPGTYEAVNRYAVPDSVSELTVTIRAADRVVRADGFRQSGERTWSWDTTTSEPTLELRVAANRTVEGQGPIGTDGTYRFVDVGDWGLVLRPQTEHRWVSSGASFDRTTGVEGEGAAGDRIAYLGPAETVRRTAHGQTIEFVVPDQSELAEPRGALFDALFGASDTLRVGDRDEEVFVVAAPTGRVEWGVRGLQIGDADTWVQADEGLAEADNVWLHEYVHTRQAFRTTGDARWLYEATASYYAARVAHEQGLISFEAFSDRLARGRADRYGTAVLADRSTWRENPQYTVGALVAGELDRRIRLATDGAESFDRVFRRVNDREGNVSASDVSASLAAAGGEAVAAAGDRYVSTTERPAVWNASQHGVAFGATPARFQVTVDGDPPVTVSGPYRSGPLGADGPVVVVPGERTTVAVRVDNLGDVAGRFNATLALDGRVVDNQSGRLAGGARTNATLAHEFRTAGEYTLSVGEDQVDVRVREPAEPAVTSLTADRTQLAPNGSVTLSIGVQNRADRPAVGSLTLRRDRRAVATRSVQLSVGGEDTLTLTRRLTAPGEYTFGLGAASDRTVTVVVEQQRTEQLLLLAAGGGLAAALLGGVLIWWQAQRGAPATRPLQER